MVRYGLVFVVVWQCLFASCTSQCWAGGNDFSRARREYAPKNNILLLLLAGADGNYESLPSDVCSLLLTKSFEDQIMETTVLSL